MSSYIPDREQFDAETAAIERWGSRTKPAIYITLMVAFLFACVLGTQFPEVKKLTVWFLAGVGALGFGVHSASQLLLTKAINHLFNYSVLADLDEAHAEVQMWLDRRDSAHRGSIYGGLISLAIACGSVVEFTARRANLPELWYGALPAAFAILVIAAHFQRTEARLSPRRLEIAARLLAKVMPKEKPK